MIPRAYIDKLTFSDGTEIQLDKSDIVLIVGPNNAGKSAALRHIRDRISNPDMRSPIISQLSLKREGSPDDVLAWIGEFAKKSKEPADNPAFQAFGGGYHRNEIISIWQRSTNGLGSLSRLFCHILTAEERLRTAEPASIIAMRDAPDHPIQHLFQDDKLEIRLSQQFKKAFGQDLVVHHGAGAQIPLLTGTRPTPKDGQDRMSPEYFHEIEKLSALREQGDGMRSFAGVLLSVSVGRESILLIDEPEAFLHPPQAGLLGRMLIEDKPVDRQLFIATHSGDILRGVLDANSSNVRVIRIRRDGNINIARELNQTKIAELWNDPLLRYSNILDGLFHEKVIVAEGDSDARFYSAVTNAVIKAKGSDLRRADLMFTHCGGKDRLKVVIRALREVDVPIKTLTDFDTLNNEHPLRDIVEAAGGDWAEIKSDWKEVKTAIESKKPELSANEVKKEIEAILNSITENLFPDSAKQSIQRIFRRSSPWANAKTGGKSFVPNGQPTQAYDRLISNLKKLEIYIVEEGEVESFVRSIGNHGPDWVNEVIKLDLATNPQLKNAREFISSIIE